MDFRDLYTPGKVTFEESFPPAGWDPHERLAVMDSERIDVSVLYPTMGLFWEGWMGDDRDLLAAYCRAYNDWVWDFCATDAQRLIPAGHVSLRNLDAAVAEVHRLTTRGFRTIFIAPDVIDGHRFSEPMFDPFWRACEEAELPVGLHVVARPVRDHAVPDMFDGVNLPFHVSMTFPSDVMYGFAAAMFWPLRALPAAQDGAARGWRWLGASLSRSHGRQMGEARARRHDPHHEAVGVLRASGMGVGGPR